MPVGYSWPAGIRIQYAGKMALDMSILLTEPLVELQWAPKHHVGCATDIRHQPVSIPRLLGFVLVTEFTDLRARSPSENW